MLRRPTPTARYPLEAVRSASTVRVGRGRARDEVRRRLRAQGKPMSDPEAAAYVRSLVAGLQPEAFCASTELAYAETRPVVADIYGVRNQHGDWYVKLYLLRGRAGDDVVVCSCHEPQGTLMRADGQRIGKPRR